MKIRINNHDGRLRLRWHDGIKLQSLAVGVADTPVGRAQANIKRGEILRDWEAGYYDQTLVKYRPQTIGKNASEITAAELFDRFAANQLKQKGLAKRSIETRYKPIVQMLKKHLDKPAHLIGKREAETFAVIAERSLTGRTAKERVWLLHSAWEWATDKYQVAPVNPWRGVAKRFQITPKQMVKPFTVDELRAILSAFKVHPSYQHYGDFVSFLANTGCRFGEAAGLRWKHLGADYLTTWIGESCSRGVRRSTKTGKARTILLSPSVQRMLAARFEAMQPKPDDLVFPAPMGGAIDDQNFRPRAWKQILMGCSIEYRRPYALRHSAISHALANGANPIAIAEQTGHSPKVLLETYAHVIAKEYLFVEV
jgi:integrase